jgi:hypothetical protein
MLRINYRTSHQIRTQADRLLGPEVSDVDGNKEERKGTISTFNGPPPETTAGEDKVSREIEAFVRGNPAPGLQMRADVAALRPLGVFDRQSRYNKKAEDA